MEIPIAQQNGLYLTWCAPVTTQRGPNMSMTVRRASADDSAWMVMSRPEPRTE
jgi:hypothetical protein